MRNHFQIKSFSIATFFLVAYLNVFATQASCNLPHFFEDLSRSAQHQDNSHNHQHDTNETSSNHHDGNTNHHSDTEKDSNCCNDKTSEFYANQGNSVISSIDFKNIFCKDFVVLNTQIVCDLPEFYNKEISSYSLPPPKIPDIRIFIRSFII